MTLTTDDFFKIQAELSAKDVQIAMLQREVDRLTEENQRLARNAAAQQPAERPDGQYITLDIEAVCRVLRGLPNVQLITFLYAALRKMLPADAPPEVIRQITDSVSLTVSPGVNITAEGDVNVAGNLNHVHDNEQVNL